MESYADKKQALEACAKLGCPKGSLRVVTYKQDEEKGGKVRFAVGLNYKSLDIAALATASGKLCAHMGSEFASRFNAGIGLALGVIVRASTGGKESKSAVEGGDVV